MADPRIDIADIAAIAPPFDVGAPAPAQPTEAIEPESEFDIAAVAAVDDFDPFFETATYYPRSGGSRSIRAIIIRQEIADLEDMSDVNAPVAVVHVKNNNTEGIASFEIDRGGDQISYSYMLGKTAQRRPITRVLSIDYAWLKLEVR